MTAVASGVAFAGLVGTMAFDAATSGASTQPTTTPPTTSFLAPADPTVVDPNWVAPTPPPSVDTAPSTIPAPALIVPRQRRAHTQSSGS